MIKSKSANQSKKYFKKNRNLFEKELDHDLQNDKEKSKMLQEITNMPIEEEIDIEEYVSSPSSLQDSMPVIKIPTLF